LGFHRIERDALLVAVDLQEQRALAVLTDGSNETILATVAFLDANDFRTELRQQCRAIGTCDIASEIEDAHALQNSPHRTILRPSRRQAPICSTTAPDGRSRACGNVATRTFVPAHFQAAR